MTQIHLSRPARHVALITIDNPPKMNAMTRPMLAELGRMKKTVTVAGSPGAICAVCASLKFAMTQRSGGTSENSVVPLVTN